MSTNATGPKPSWLPNGVPMQSDRSPVLPHRGPYARLPAGLPPMAFGRPVRPCPLLAGIRVLVVEDDADSREALCLLLEMEGANVLCVESVAQAVDGVLRSFDANVVLTDYSMPGGDGLDLIREFRKAPSTRAVAVPILVLTGHTEDDWRARALAAGAADLLVKPFDSTLLIARVAAAAAPGRERTLAVAERRQD
jgi:CheY-like chemotaxis protein